MDFSNMTILLVDDNPVNLKVIKETLLSLNIGIKVSLSGENALEVLKDLTPSLIILDIMMPEMDGFELCAQIKKINRLNNVPVIFVTALNDTESEAKGLELGAIDFISKPINPTLVKARVKNILELKYYQQILETKIETSEKQFFKLFDNSPDAQLLVTFDGFIIKLANKASEELFGYTKEKLCTMTPFDLTPEFQPNGKNSHEFGVECYKRSIIDKSPFFEWVYINNKEEELFCEVRLMSFPGDESMFRVSIFDISERKRHEAEIFKANKYIESIMNSMPFSVIGVDDEYRVTHWNDFVQNTHDKNRESVIGKEIVSVLPQMKLELDIIHKSITEGVIKKRVKRSRVTKSGTVYENIAIFPLVSEGLSGAVIIIDDITKEVGLQDKVVQSQRMLFLGDLIAGIVHEITSPLAGIIQNSQSLNSRLTAQIEGNIEAAKKHGLNFEALSSYLEERKILRMISSIKTSALKASHIIKNLNSFTVEEKSSLSLIQLNDLVNQAIELAENEVSISSRMDFKTIDKRIKQAGNLPLVKCDGSKITQVIVDIIRFSIKNIGLRSLNSGIVEINTYLNGDYVCIELTDNGIEIPQEDLENIFIPYFESISSRDDWYYLALCDFVIREIHNGDFQVSSRPKNRYIISLPFKDE